MIAHWANYAHADYLPFVQEARPELVQVGFYGAHYWSLAHTKHGAGYPAHFPKIGLKQNRDWLKLLNRDLHQFDTTVVGHFNIEFLVGDPESAEGPRGFFKFYSELWEEKLLGPRPVVDPLQLLEKNADGTPIQFVDVFPRTPDGKVQLFPEELERESPAGLYRYREDPATSDYPLTLISPATEKTICSTLGELRTRVASLQMHPDDADARELSTGDTARMFNALGEVHCPVTRNADMRRGTVGLPKGLWRMSTFNGSTANALVSDDLTDIGGGAVFNDARVEVARVMRASFDKQNLALWTTDPVKPVH